jgi:hypothetical protein
MVVRGAAVPFELTGSRAHVTRDRLQSNVTTASAVYSTTCNTYGAVKATVAAHFSPV